MCLYGYIDVNSSVILVSEFVDGPTPSFYQSKCQSFDERLAYGVTPLEGCSRFVQKEGNN